MQQIEEIGRVIDNQAGEVGAIAKYCREQSFARFLVCKIPGKLDEARFSGPFDRFQPLMVTAYGPIGVSRFRQRPWIG